MRPLCKLSLGHHRNIQLIQTMGTFCSMRALALITITRWRCCTPFRYSNHLDQYFPSSSFIYFHVIPLSNLLGELLHPLEHTGCVVKCILRWLACTVDGGSTVLFRLLSHNKCS